MGRASCAMLALTDVGLASALAGKLAGADPEQYGAAAAELAVRAEKTLQRQKEQRRHEKNLQTGKKKPWAAPPKEAPHPPGRVEEHRRRAGAQAARPGTPPSKAEAPAPKPKRSLPRGVVTVKKKTP